LDNPLRTLFGVLKRKPVQRKGILVESMLFLAMYLLLLLILPAEAPALGLVESLALQASALAAALLILLSLVKIPAASRSAWRLMSVALMAWTVADLLAYFYNLVPGNSDIIQLIMTGINLFAYLVMGYALLRYPAEGRYAPTRFRFLLDALISAIAVVALGWLLLARPLAGASTSFLTRITILSAPLADLVLLVILSNVSLTSVMPRSTTTYLGFGLIAITLADYAAGTLAFLDSASASGFISLGWVCGTLLIGIAAVSERESSIEGQPVDQRFETSLRTQFQKVLPIALVLVLFWYVFTEWRLRAEYSLWVVWISLLLGIMLIVRLGIRAGEAELHKYWQLFRNLADPTFIVDLHGNILLSNPAFGLMTGASKTERSLFSIFTRLSVSNLDAVHQTKQAVEVEVRTRVKGSPYFITLSPLETDTGQALVAGVAHNLSEQIRQREMVQSAYDELQLLHSQLEDLNTGLEIKVEERTATLQGALSQLEEQNKVLQALDQLKSDFVSMVSHELRTPLNNLGGGLELMQKRKQKTEADSSTLNLMQAEVQRLTRFVENILNVSAIEAGRLKLQPEPLSLKSVIQDVCRNWSQGDAANRIQVSIPADLQYVMAERSALESVMGHLIDNAVKYAPDSTIEVVARPGKKVVQIEVRDHGPGIPEDKRSLMFERFQRLDARDSQSVYGYGLGLYLSQKLLKAMGSELTFRSPESGGACFSFALKAKKR
jgi:PAS domain S-box-containing protein